MGLALADEERALLRERASALPMRIVVEMAEAMGAERLAPITRAHIDGCLYHGPAGVEFAERLAADAARVRVPATLNVSALDLLHPELVRLDGETSALARRQMDAYVAMGCRPTWTCAPYQLDDRPGRGEQVAWGESNAIVFANSVLGARTERYGDFLDICCAVTGRVPLVGLHTDEGRRAELVLDVTAITDRLLMTTAGAAALGLVLGERAGATVAAIAGLPPTISEDALKALGAAAATSGAVALFHAIGVTPEAPTLASVAREDADLPVDTVTTDALRRARDRLTTSSGSRIGAVTLGTPHASAAELEHLARLVGRWPPVVPMYVNAGRDTLAGAGAAAAARLAEAGVHVVTDTCAYLTPVIHDVDAPLMTDSAKAAWYAPANLGVDVVFGTTEECVRSAAAGSIRRDEELWGVG
jgi:hypothetical protein